MKILAQDFKDEADEPLSEIVEHKVFGARDCTSDHMWLSAGSAVLWDPGTAAGTTRTRPAGKL
jgi:hypothetical protein